MAKVEFHSEELFPRVRFIVTNLTLPSRAVVRFYNKRGTAEQWIKEGMQAVKMTAIPGAKLPPVPPAAVDGPLRNKPAECIEPLGNSPAGASRYPLVT